MSLVDNPRWQILLKEIDLIHSSIKNLDDIIFKTKNFAFLFWGGSLYLIIQHLKNVDHTNLLILATSAIPIIFWTIHSRWQTYLFKCSQREKMISFFLNSDEFEQWLRDPAKVRFPLYDIPGWLYTKKGETAASPKVEFEIKADERFFVEENEKSAWQLFFYKDAKWFYSIMLLTSILLSIVYAPK